MVCELQGGGLLPVHDEGRSIHSRVISVSVYPIEFCGGGGVVTVVGVTEMGMGVVG